MSKVLEGLWICDWQDVRNPSFLKSVGATHMLNCAINLPQSEASANLNLVYAKLELEDGWSKEEDPQAREEFSKGAALLQDWFKPNSVILVHCQAGISRSPATVMTWLIKYRGQSVENAHTMVKRARPFIRPNPFYMFLLNEAMEHREAPGKKLITI
jgi:dual specificity phosphatase 12